MKKNYSIGEINKAIRLDAKGFVNECTDEFEKRITEFMVLRKYKYKKVLYENSYNTFYLFVC